MDNTFKDETDAEFEARIAAHESQLEQDRLDKLAKLEEKTPAILKLQELKTKNELLDKQLQEVEALELKQANYQLITLKEIYGIEYPAENWLIDKILLERGFSMLVGDTGTGKSFLSLYMAKCLVTGESFLDQFEIRSQVPVLIIDKENGLRRAKQRLQSLNCPATDQIFFLKYPEKFSLEDQDFITALHDLIIEKGIKVVILDSFVDVILGNENDAGHISDVYNALRCISTEVSWWMLHHESKPMAHSTRTTVQRTRGSSNIAAQLDNQFYIEKTPKSGVINVEQSKARDFEALKKSEIEFITDSEGNLTGFKYLGEVQDETSKVDEAAKFIINYLSINPNSWRKNLIEDAEENHSSVSIDRAIKMLKEKKIINADKVGSKVFYSITGEVEFEAGDEA